VLTTVRQPVKRVTTVRQLAERTPAPLRRNVGIDVTFTNCREDGTFKMVEVSDIHHTGNLFCKDISAAQEKYPCSDANATTFFQKLIELEDPDVFVFTGDNVCGGDIFGGQNALDGLLKDFVSADYTGPPWLLVEGNVSGRRSSAVAYHGFTTYVP